MQKDDKNHVLLSSLILNLWYKMKRMKAEELRIGNWVFNKATERKQLKEIYSDCSVYDPIPLTEEWLLKFGFEKEIMFDEGVFLKGKYLVEKGMSYFFNNGYSFRITTSNIESTHASSVIYVHQLQNLYFALTGTELTIK